MLVSAIAAVSKNRAIGYENKLLWDIPDDLKHFKKITEGHTVVMGSKTYESIGRPLPKRVNIILTRNKDYAAPGCIIANSLEEAIERAKEEEEKSDNDKKEVFVIGGEQIYTKLLPWTQKLYLTIVDDNPKEVDSYFPDYSMFKNLVSESETFSHHGIDYKFIELTR